MDRIEQLELELSNLTRPEPIIYRGLDGTQARAVAQHNKQVKVAYTTAVKKLRQELKGLIKIKSKEPRIPVVPLTTEEKFWLRVDKTPGFGRDGDCWKWTGSKDENGYGKMRFGRQFKEIRASRYSYELHKEPLGELLACHTCDNPPCVNPDHLFAGTYRDNLYDMIAKGRYRGAPRGSLNKISKLTEIQVLEIKRLMTEGVSQNTLARQFGVSRSCIADSAQKKKWAWLSEDTYQVEEP